MQIIGHTFRPFTRKMRIVALERGIPIEFIEDMPLAETTAVPKYNPLGKVPVLVRDDGSALIDSPLIAAWLDAHGEGEGLIPADQPHRICVQQWEAVADGVADAAVLMRAENLRPEGERSRAWAQRQQTKVERGLRWMNERLGGKYCVGERLSLADIALGCCVSYLEFRFPDGRWRDRYKAVSRSSLAMEERPSFQATPMRAWSAESRRHRRQCGEFSGGHTTELCTQTVSPSIVNR